MSARRSQPPRSKSGGATPFARLQAQLQALDLLFEVRDARLPVSSAHPKAAELFGSKPRVLVLAKQDLAEPEVLKVWLDELSSDETSALALSFKLRKGQEKLVNVSLELTKQKRENLARKGLLPRPMRACVVGLPNTGKSTLINWLTGKHKARTGDAPGVTRGTQWIRVHPQLELLDTPGLLPPVAFEHGRALKLSLCNLLPQDHYDTQEVAEFGLQWLMQHNPEALAHYGEQVAAEGSLQSLAVARSCVAAGGVADERRAASIFVNDFRDGKLGRYVLDTIE